MIARSPLRSLGSLLAAALLFALAACGPAAPPPASPAPEAAATTTASSAAPAAPPASAAAATPAAGNTPSASPTPAKQGVLADSSSPQGASPLSEAESKEFSAQCKKFTDAVAAAAKKDRGKKRSIDILAEILANPPKVAGVDVPRCSEWMRRDTVAYLARMRESEARFGIKRILVGMMSALEREPPVFCPSAPPVPASLEAVKEKPYESTMAEWTVGGWACSRFDMAGSPQVFQYEIRTDANAKSFEIIARGYPVLGAPPTELYVAGKAVDGRIDPATPVMRRFQ